MTHQATDTASAALLKLVEKWRAKQADDSRYEDSFYIAGWNAAVRRCTTELEAALASLPAPAAPEKPPE